MYEEKTGRPALSTRSSRSFLTYCIECTKNNHFIYLFCNGNPWRMEGTMIMFFSPVSLWHLKTKPATTTKAALCLWKTLKWRPCMFCGRLGPPGLRGAAGPCEPCQRARADQAARPAPGGPPCSWQPACAFLDGDPAAWKRAASENRPCPSRPRSKAQGRRQSSGSGRDVTRNVLEAGWCRPQAAAGEPGRGAACKLRTGFPWEDWSGDEKRTESRIWLHTVSFSVEDGSVVLEFVRKAVELVCVTSCR